MLILQCWSQRAVDYAIFIDLENLKDQSLLNEYSYLHKENNIYAVNLIGFDIKT